VIVVASLVGAFPVVTQVAMASPLLGTFPTKQAAQQALGTPPTVSQSSVVLPQGKELGDEALAQTDGEWWPIVWYVGEFMVSGGGAALVYRIGSRSASLGRTIGVAAISGATAVANTLLHQAADEASNTSNDNDKNKAQDSNSSDEDQDDQGFYNPYPLGVQHQSYTVFQPMR